MPFAALDVVEVPQDHEDPSHLEEVSKSRWRGIIVGDVQRGLATQRSGGASRIHYGRSCIDCQ
jgi:hypothetical protein